MKVIYKGYEIDVHRAESMGCGEYLYFSIFRLKDGRECLSSFTSGGDTVRDYVRYMKERIDAELADEDPWGEKASEYPLGYMQGRGAA
jgi:hypothetical protein